MKIKRITAAILAAFLAVTPVSEAFAAEPETVEEQPQDITPVLPDNLDFSQPGLTVRTGVVPDCTSIIFTVPKEKYELYQQAYAESGRAGVCFDVKLDDYYVDEEFGDPYGTSVMFTFFGDNGANGDIIECDCATDDWYEVWTGTTENGDVVGMLYGESDQWVFQQALKSVTCQLRYNIMSAGQIVDGSGDYSTYILRPGEEHDISKCKFKALPTVTYTGKEFKPDVEAEYDDWTLVKGRDYTVEYRDNIVPGIASVKVTGINSYKGTKTLKFKIAPAKTTLKGTKNKNAKKATLTWTRPAGVYPNFEVQAAEGKDKFAKLTDIENNKLFIRVKWTADSGCRFRVRPYVTVNGKRIYGKWSNVVKFK